MEAAFISHPLFATVVASNIHPTCQIQEQHIQFHNKAANNESSHPSQSHNGSDDNGQQTEPKIVKQEDSPKESSVYKRIGESLVHSRKQQGASGNRGEDFEGLNEDFNVDELVFHQNGSDANQGNPNQEELTELLVKVTTLNQIHQAETDMMDTLLDSFLKEMKEALQISETTSPSMGSPPNGILQTSQSLSNSQHSFSDDSPSTPTNISQAAPMSFSTISSTPSSSGASAAVMGSGGGGYGQKKPEEVISELKKKYSGQVLQVAQSKKKKKNFAKDATDHLNMWFFNHLHDPYPTDDEKKQLSQLTNLSLSQVNNWFGNKRMRYKRKMLEQNRRASSSVGMSQNDINTSPSESHTPTNQPPPGMGIPPQGFTNFNSSIQAGFPAQQMPRSPNYPQDQYNIPQWN